jgi:hypothetical protein
MYPGAQENMGKREEQIFKALSVKYLKAWGQMPSRSFMNWLDILYSSSGCLVKYCPCSNQRLRIGT